MFSKKGQGAIEYLLIIGAAILIVAMVIISITGATTTGGEKLEEEEIRDTTLILICQKECINQGFFWQNNKCSENTSQRCIDFNVPE